MNGDAYRAASHALSALTGLDQSKRLLTLTFPRNDGPADATLLANRLLAREEVSRDFRFDVEVLSDNARIPLKAMMGRMVTISLVREDGSLRYFNGLVTEFRLSKSDGGFAYYDMVLEPWLALARLRKNSVSFHGRHVVDITELTFQYYPESNWRTSLRDKGPTLSCANQHNETDHNHLYRRWEDQGWHTWYEHRADGHTLWIADDSRRAEPIDGDSAMPFQDQAGSLEDDGIHDWQAVRRLGSGSVSLASFDYKNTRAQIVRGGSTNDQGEVPRHEVYENTGAYGYTNDLDGEPLAQRRMEEIDARGQHFEARGNDRAAQPGRWFTLTGHVSGEPKRRQRGDAAPENIAAREYLILSVTHTASNNYQAGPSAPSHYENNFTCLRKAIRWRPGRGFNSRGTTIYGAQTAIVVGPPGEEIHTDNYGRIKVQFHWDRLGTFNAQSSAWIRVMSSWAGTQFGAISLPRIGQEVVVQFLDGNPDHPIVVGSVYNRTHMPPWDLPLNKTQSGILTRSTIGGLSTHANALRFEDQRGQEQLWLHAEKDQLTEVEHDEDKWVGHDRRKKIDHDETTQIGHDRTETVGNDEHITVHNNRGERVDHNETISIGGNRTEEVGKNEQVHIGGNRAVQVSGHKSERVTLSKEETIGLAKALTVGLGYEVTVGAAMNTFVALTQSTEVLLDKLIKVGQVLNIDVGNRLALDVGKAGLRMTQDGAVTLFGSSINIQATGPVKINGKDVDINGGGSTIAQDDIPSTPQLFNDKFKVVDDDSGKLLPNTEYALLRENGALETGTTDENGITHLLSPVNASETIVVYT